MESKDTRIQIRGISPLGEETCRIINTLSEMNNDYIICKRSNGEEIVCKHCLGSWTAMSLYDLVLKINFLQNQIDNFHDDKHEPMEMRWKCGESPSSFCEYNDEDPMHDVCIHCGAPEERK